MNATTLRAWWAHRQGLDGSLTGQLAEEVLARTGWARSVGGATPYLTLFARAGLSRAAADQALAELRIHELPAARGCTYVVPQADYALALTVGQGFTDQAQMRTARTLGVTDGEIDKLSTAVLDALAQAPLEPDELRQAVGGAVRSLGPEGIRKGMASTLPTALGRLQSAGEIRRIPTNGRLDQQRYRYARWQPNPLAGVRPSPEEAHAELARRYFRWIGPATLAEFQWFSGLGVKQTKAAVSGLGLVPLADGDARLLFPEHRDALRTFTPREAEPTLVSSLDGITHLRRNVRDLLAEADQQRPVCGEKAPQVAGGLTDLPNHAILRQGQLVGLWEYDAKTQRIAWSRFGGRDEALEQAVARTETFVRDELGDARSFSLDSPKSRAARVAALQAG